MRVATDGTNPNPERKNIMSLIIAKNKVSREQLAAVKTPDPTDSFTPIPHSYLAEEIEQAISRAGFQVTEQEHALARGGQRYFGGFAITGPNISGDERKLVVGARNSSDKSFAASICLGMSMIVCENLCFSAEVKLARRHTTNIFNDLPRVLSNAVAKCVSHWETSGRRIETYQQTEINESRASDLLISLVDAKAFPARDLYPALQEFRNPRHPEFKGNTLWNLYNSVTENLKGGDLTKLPMRTIVMESIFDRVSGLVSSVAPQDDDVIIIDLPA